MRHAWAAMLATILVGCASSNIVVKLPSPKPSPPFEAQMTAKVTVNDLRSPGVAASTRQAAFGVPMGNVTFDPPERQLVKDTLERALAPRQPSEGIPSGMAYVCDIVEFGVNTHATALYWDVVGVIRLTLRHNGREQALFATHTERTYVWPGEAVIRKVVEESLRKIGQEFAATEGRATVGS